MFGLVNTERKNATVLPGPAKACPPVQQKNTPLFGENTPLLHIFFKFRYFSAFSCHFLRINFENENTIFIQSQQFHHV
jgi:hypothetical protein